MSAESSDSASPMQDVAKLLLAMYPSVLFQTSSPWNAAILGKTLSSSKAAPTSDRAAYSRSRRARHRVACMGVHPRAPAALKEAYQFLENRDGEAYKVKDLFEHLKSKGIRLPDQFRNSEEGMVEFIDAQPELVIRKEQSKGFPQHVVLFKDTTACRLVRKIVAVLKEGGPASSSLEIGKRLKGHGQQVPGINKLVLNHADFFDLDDGSISLTDYLQFTPDVASADVSDESLFPLFRELRTLDVPVNLELHQLPDLEKIGEVLLLDLDCCAFALTPSVIHAWEALDDNVLVLGFSTKTHDQKVTPEVGDRMEELAMRGRLRLFTPEKDVANAADFLLSFWVGWLHSRLSADAKFVIRTVDIHLDKTITDILKQQKRELSVNPPVL